MYQNTILENDVMPFNNTMFNNNEWTRRRAIKLDPLNLG